MNKGKFKVFINNNPKCSAILESTAKKEVWEMKNVPYLIIEGTSLNDERERFKVIHDDKVLYDDMVKIVDEKFEIRIDLEEPINIDTSDKIQIILGEVKQIIPIKLYRLYGTVKYYNGKNVKKPIINITFKDIITVGDEEGNFEIFFSEKEAQIGVFEKGYSKTTLESWIYNIDLNEDKKIDIKIDKMEVYRIHMWNGEASDYIHFTPMSLIKTLHSMEKGFENQLGRIKYKDIWPRLKKEDVRVFADDCEVEILTFSIVEDFLTKEDGQVYTRPSCVISIPKGNKNKVIKIEIKNKFALEGKQVEEYGESCYLWK